MRTHNAPKDSFNYYLQEVEKKENAQRRRLIVLVVGLFIGFGILGATFIFSFYSTQEKDYSPFEEADSKKKGTLLAHQSAKLTRYESATEIVEEGYPTCLDSIICEISGELKVDHPVYFHIANYDEGITYLMTYGEGSLKRVPPKHCFTFKTPGEYQIKISAINPGQKVPINTYKTLFIQPKKSLRSTLEEKGSHS